MPEFSIIVPIYKVEKYLAICVDSIIGQSFCDFELILVDDGSPDTCGEICDKYSSCQAKNTRMSDMTIADFWGIEEIAPEMDDGKGTSLIITRTNKGQNLFDSIEMDLRWKEVNYEDGVRHNVSEFSSVAMPQQRDSFFTDMNSMSFKSLSNKYIYGPLWKRIGRKIKHTMQYTISNPGGAKSK